MKNQKASFFEVSLLESGLIAIGLVTFVYCLILPRLKEIAIGEIVIKSGWVGIVIMVLGFWSLVILCWKAFTLSQKRLFLREDLIPATISTSVCKENALHFIRYLQSRFSSSQSHPAKVRLEKGLRHLSHGHRVPDVIQDLLVQSQTDEEQLESSYMMIRAFVWAIPILGFIGTVLGIGQAIGGFASSLQSAEDLATIKSTLGHVVTGLAFAFDTTFLGLIISLIVMFPMNLIHRAEKALLTEVDDYCSEHFIHRLHQDDNDSIVKALSGFSSEIRAFRKNLAVNT